MAKPLVAGAVHVSVTWLSAATAEVVPGAAGVAIGVADVYDGEPAPLAFAGVTFT